MTGRRRARSEEANRGDGKERDTQSDARIEDALREAIFAQPDLDHHRVLVQVDRDGITLRGHARNPHERTLLEDVVRSRTGDIDISNLVTLDWLVAVQATAWAKFLENDLREHHEDLAAADLRVATCGETVELTGSTSSPVTRELAEYALARLGVREIRNCIRVRQREG